MVTRFSVAGAEGYMTASSYPDDGIGEVFLKLGKQGSTLAGPVKLRPQHLGHVILGLLLADHFVDARGQSGRAVAVLPHFLLGGDRAVTGDYCIEIEH